jgi:hypothetical protein
VTQTFFPGTNLDALLEDDTLGLDGRALDADVHGGRGPHALALRLVGVQTPKGDGFFLTHLPPRLGPRQGADLYRVRWEVELSIKLDTSVHRLDQVAAERPCSVKTLLHASLMAASIAALRAHTPHVKTRPQQASQPRTAAPLPPRRLALQLAVSCQSIAPAVDRHGIEAERRWNKLAELLTHTGRDPNWRRRPSVLDQLRGWNRQPMARKEARSIKAAPENLKAAA